MEKFYKRLHLFKFVHKEAKERTMVRMLVHDRVDEVLTNPTHLLSLAKLVSKKAPIKLLPLLPPAQINYASPIIAKIHPRAQQIKTEFDVTLRALVADGLYDELERIHGVRLKHRP